MDRQMSVKVPLDYVLDNLKKELPAVNINHSIKKVTFSGKYHRGRMSPALLADSATG